MAQPTLCDEIGQTLQHSLHIYVVSREDGTLSFEEFKAGFTPLVTFQIHQLRGRVVEIKRSRTRVERERERTLA